MSVSAPPEHPCSDCGRTAPRVSRLPEGGGVCRRCYNARRREECAQCGRHRPPTTRNADGKPLCGHCARPRRVCTGCGRTVHITAHTAVGAVCQRCYQVPTRACGRCGEVRRVAAREQHGHHDVCKRCYETGDAVCAICRQRRPVHVRNWPIGEVCASCYRRFLRTPQLCFSCSDIKVLIGRSADGDRICGPCAGSTLDYICSTCGAAGDQHFEQTCIRCSVAVLTRDLLRAEKGTVSDRLADLPDLLARRGNPLSTLRWLQKPAVRTLLGNIGSAASITHATVDACASGQARHAFRAVLIETGILSPRNEQLDRLESWVDEFTSSLPAEHAAVIGPYGKWRILRAIRRRARRARVTVGIAGSGRGQIRHAARLLAYAEQQGCRPGALTQESLDSWTAGIPSRTNTIAPFIRWLNATGITDELRTKYAQSDLPGETSSDEEHHQRIRELVAGTGLTELTTRVAGLLILLYGARLDRIHRLTTKDVTISRGRTYLALSIHPIELPAPVGQMVRQMVARAESAPQSLTRTADAHYLFFSPRRAYEPIHPHTLGRQLSAAGIPTRLSRNHALLALATELPAAVIAAQLDLRPQTTVRWARLSQRDNAEYLVARTVSRPGRS